jgi:hypothetical protein
MPWYTAYDDEYGAQEYYVPDFGKPGESDMANDAAGLLPYYAPTILEPEVIDPFVFSGKPGESNMANWYAGLLPAPAGTGEGYSGFSVADSNAANAAGFDIGKAVSGLGSSLVKSVVDRYKSADGSINWGNVAKDAATAYMAKTAYDQASKPITPTGYQGGIPEYTGVREQLTPVAGTRPGAGGQRYFTDLKYATGAGLPAAQAAVTAQAAALNAQNAGLPKAPAAPRPNAPVTEQATIPGNQRPVFTNNDQIMAWNNANASGPLSPNWVMPDDTYYGPTPTPPPVGAAEGGLMGYAKGGVPTKREGTYLRGETDGMADQIKATIDGKQPARLAHGEFVVPADVVSHLGNGNSDAGAKQLYKMMDRIRMARTGNKKQGKEIDPNKFAPGGIAAYAEGGTIASQVSSGITGQESNLSNWVGPYVTNMLGKGRALSEQPYQAYQGPLTAGPSALQQTGFQNAANLATPMGIGQAANTAGGIAGQKQTSSFLAPGTAQSYMNPYMQNVVDIQKQEAQRQADIASTARQAQQTQAGAFGGSRAAVMDAEAARNLALQQGQIQATGLQSAYDAATKQFNTEQTTGLAGVNTQLTAAQAQGNLGATQNAAGLANLNAQLTAGGTQQGIEQAGVTADQAAFNAERDNPYKMVQYQQSLLQGLPLAAQSYSITNNPYAAAANAATGIYSMFNTAAK